MGICFVADYGQCGLGMENVGNEANRGRILNGKKSIEPWPWMAALYMPVDKSNLRDTDVSEHFGYLFIYISFTKHGK